MPSKESLCQGAVDIRLISCYADLFSNPVRNVVWNIKSKGIKYKSSLSRNAHKDTMQRQA